VFCNVKLSVLTSDSINSFGISPHMTISNIILPAVIISWFYMCLVLWCMILLTNITLMHFKACINYANMFIFINVCAMYLCRNSDFLC